MGRKIDDLGKYSNPQVEINLILPAATVRLYSRPCPGVEFVRQSVDTGNRFIYNALVMAESPEIKGAQPNEILTPEKVIELNSSIWKEQYSKQHDYLGAESMARSLREKADEQGIKSPDIIAELWATEAWSQYRQDVNAKTKDNRSWKNAKEGIGLLIDPNANHEIRSRLLGVAGLCQAFLVNEQDEPAEPLLMRSLEEAKSSGNLSLLGESTNEFALGFFARARQEKDPNNKKEYYQKAIPFFEDAVRIHEEAGTQDEKAGHPYNNLIECYSSVGRYEDALKSAEKASEKYKENEDPTSPHCFSMRFRKSIALRGLGRFDEALEIYEQHKKLRIEDSKLSDQEKARLIENEDKNIEATNREM